MGEGNGNGKVRVCSKGTTRGAKAISVCMIQPFIISVFQNLGSGCFFRSPAFFSESGGKFCRIEVRHFFPPKGGSRYILYFISSLICIYCNYLGGLVYMLIQWNVCNRNCSAKRNFHET